MSELKQEPRAAHGRVVVVEPYCRKTDLMHDHDQAKPLDAIVKLLLLLLGADRTIFRDAARYESLHRRLGELKGAGH